VTGEGDTRAIARSAMNAPTPAHARILDVIDRIKPAAGKETGEEGFGLSREEVSKQLTSH